MKFLFIICLLMGLSACKNNSTETTTITTEVTKTKKTETSTPVVKESVKELAQEIKKAEATIEVKKPKKEKRKVDKENIWTIKLKTGTVTLELFPDTAPKHVERIRTLTKKGFYNGLKFHRVIEGFMAQTGDPKGDGTGGSDMPNLQSEFSSKPFDRGVLGMARAASPHSANSQFFIMLQDGHFLNNKYTVFGKVISGMEHVDKIKLGDRAANGSVTDPDTMLEVTIGG